MDVLKSPSMRLVGALVLIVMAAVAVDRVLADDNSSNCCFNEELTEGRVCCACSDKNCSFSAGDWCVLEEEGNDMCLVPCEKHGLFDHIDEVED